MMSSLALEAYLIAWVPFEADSFDFLGCLNEGIFLICCYMMFLYTDYVPNPSIRYEFGSYFLYMLYVNLAVNLLILTFEISKMIKKYCRRFFYHRKLRNEKQKKIEAAK
jgi:hypothetical protein